MKYLAVIVLTIFLIGFFAFIIMAVMSHKKTDHLGLLNGLLRSCPDSPNCVSSEAVKKSDSQHTIPAIYGNQQTWLQLKKAIAAQGGIIQTNTNTYIHAEFTSSVFRYVDDMEFRLDEANNQIHMRSASRVGRSDFGANRKRSLNIQAALEKEGRQMKKHTNQVGIN